VEAVVEEEVEDASISLRGQTQTCIVVINNNHYVIV